MKIGPDKGLNFSVIPDLVTNVKSICNKVIRSHGPKSYNYSNYLRKKYDVERNKNTLFSTKLKFGSVVIIRNLKGSKILQKEQICKIVRTLDRDHLILRDFETNNTFKCLKARVSKVSNSSIDSPHV